MEEITLSSILDFGRLESMFKHFSVTSGLSVMLLDDKGVSQLSYGEENICALAKGCEKCRQSLVYGGKKAAELGEPYIFSCACGLIMCSSPVLFDDVLVGSIVCGPVMLWEADEYAYEELKTKSSGILPSKDIEKVIAGIKQLSCVNMTSSAQMLFIIADYMALEESRHLKQRSRITAQQARIAELLADKKQTAASVDVLEQSSHFGKYPKNYEKELIAYVQMGDKVNATRILNTLLGEIFSLSAAEMETTKARLYELSAFLSRAAVEAGATLEALTPTLKKSAKILDEDTDFETLCYIVNEIMIEFMDAVYLHRQAKAASGHLSRAIAYIKANFGSDLSLDLVASKVYVSSYYLSHLFREEMNMTYSDYVVSVRIEEAKILLKKKTMKAFDVSAACGFNDANYFAKTFKKLTGLSPKQYMSVFL